MLTRRHRILDELHQPGDKTNDPEAHCAGERSVGAEVASRGK